MGAALHIRRTKVTPKQSAAEAFARIAQEEAYEYGHSYSGTFGSKDSVRVFKTKLTPRQFKALEQMIIDAMYGELKIKAQSIEDRTAKKVGLSTIMFYARIVDDKWGPALGLCNHNGQVLFIGMCSE